MRDVSLALRRFTTYGPLATLLLAIAGFWFVLLTFPNLFYSLASMGLPAGMGSLIDAVRGVADSLLNGQRSLLTGSWRIPLAVALPFLVSALVVAALIRSARARSWQPATSVLLHLALGVISFPLFSWVAQLIIWVFSFGSMVVGWISALLATDVFRIIGTVLLWIGALAALAFVGYLVVESVTARWVVAGLLAVGVGLYLARDVVFPFLAPIFSAVFGAIATVVGLVFFLILAALLWVAAILVLAYLGGTVVTPLRDALRSGREPNRLADLGAGVGVAISTLIAAASFGGTGRTGFAALLTQAATVRSSLPLGSLPSILELRFDAVMPHAFDPAMRVLFTGFNGALDVAVVVAACILGILVLLFTSGSVETGESGPTIVTLALLRVLLVLVIAVMALWLTSTSSSG